MKVNKEIYYHASSLKSLSVGDVLKFNSNTKNGMYYSVYNSNFSLNGIDANELLVIKRKNNDMDFSVDELSLIFKTINNDAFVLRELALEKIRSSKYPNFPSRLSCLYVTKEKKDAVTWSKILMRNGKKCSRILKLELTGDIYTFDGGMLLRKNCSYQEHLENAERYWNSVAVNEPEHLFLGSARIIEIEEI